MDREFIEALLAKWRQANAIGELQGLSLNTAVRQTDDALIPQDVAQRCAVATDRARSYRSKVVIRDRTDDTLKAQDYVGLEWRLDFQKPDRFYVTQTNWSADPDSLWDEWMTLGNENHLHMFGWMRVAENNWDETNDFLRIDRCLQVLREVSPIASERYDYNGDSFLYLDYSLADYVEGGSLAPLSESL